MINDLSYISIAGWMINRLGLSGNELLIYAAIYGYSQDESSDFHGSGSYLASWCGCSLRSVQRSLKSLQERGLIEQGYHSPDNREVHYRAVIDTYDKMSQGVVSDCRKAYDKMSQGVVSKCRKTYDKMSQANNDDNIADNIADKLVDNIVVCDTKRTQFKKPTLEEVKEYAKRNGKIISDPERFFEYYSANGWKVGRNPMKDWKAAFRMWESKDKKTAEADKGFQRDQYGVKYMVNDYSSEEQKNDNQKANDLLDQLLEDD